MMRTLWTKLSKNKEDKWFVQIGDEGKLLNEDLVVDDLVFPASTSVNLLYNFPFYLILVRQSYLRKSDFELTIIIYLIH